MEQSLHFHSVREDPFVIDGLWNPREPGAFRRMPKEVAESVSSGVATLATNTAGGRIRFSTDADRLVIRSDVFRNDMQNMTTVGSSGFDLYLVDQGDERLCATYTYVANGCDYAGEGVSKPLPGKRMRDYVLYLPLYTSLSELHLGIPKTATFSAPKTEYRISEPIVFYGSSITQGASASRPGLAYEAIISRRLHAQFQNLGFSGSARAEDAMIEYLAQIPSMSAFVCDYDHNAPDAQHLRNTHAKLYHAVRRAHPDLPIVLVTAPVYGISSPIWTERRAIIMETYLNGWKAGDRNLYFVDGFTMMLDDTVGEGHVDGCHPNDLGMRRMAYAIGETLDDIFFHRR